MRRLAVVTLATCLLASPGVSGARSLEQRLSDASQLVGISSGSAFDALAKNIADTAARSVPVISSSAGFTYRYNAATEVFERTSETLGPLFLERPDTLGQGKFNLSVTFQYVQMDAFDGSDLTNLQSPDPIVVKAFDANGNSAGFRATRLRYSLGLQQYVTTLSATYGITDDLDVNLLLPIIATSLRIGVYSQNVATADNVKGPYTPAPGAQVFGHDDGSAAGVGDLLLRAKYQLPRWEWLRSAVGLKLRLPSGSQSNFQGTGDVEVSPFIYLSTVLWDRVEPEVNLGIDYNANNVSLSAATYAGGFDIDATKWLNFNLAYIGRSQFVGFNQVDNTDFQHLHNGRLVSEPLLGINFSRKDTSDLSFGVRVVVWRNVMMYANGIYALNDSGLRNDTIIPAGGVEATF
jgi:hypothetical protein